MHRSRTFRQGESFRFRKSADCIIASMRSSRVNPQFPLVLSFSLSLNRWKFVSSAPEPSRARRLCARRSQPLTARTDDRSSVFSESVLNHPMRGSHLVQHDCTCFRLAWFPESGYPLNFYSCQVEPEAPNALGAKPAWLQTTPSTESGSISPR
jgi:hypothetical protein